MRCSRANIVLDKAESKGGIDNDEFTSAIQDLLVSENGYVLDTGTGWNVNAEILLRLEKKIK